MADRTISSSSIGQAENNWLTSRDPRALLLMTLVFVAGVVSVHSIRPDRLLPFLAIPLFMTLAAGLSVRQVLKRTAVALPFAVLLSLAALFSDSRSVVVGHGMTINAGLLMGMGVVMKTLLTVWMAVLLVSLLSFPVVTRAVGKLGMPGPLVQTMFFLYRYLQDMVEQVGAVTRSHRLRSGGRRRLSIQTASSIVTALLAGSLSRGVRVGRALEMRGFTGRLPEGNPLSFSLTDGISLGLMCLAVLVLSLGFDRIIYLTGVF